MSAHARIRPQGSAFFLPISFLSPDGVGGEGLKITPPRLALPTSARVAVRVLGDWSRSVWSFLFDLTGMGGPRNAGTPDGFALGTAINSNNFFREM